MNDHFPIPAKYSHGALLGLALAGMIFRYLQYPDLPAEFHLTVLGTSLVLLYSVFYFSKFVDRYLNRVFPYVRGISTRIFLQITVGLLFVLLLRVLLFHWAEPRIPFKLDKLFLLATYALFMAVSLVMNSVFIALYFLGEWKQSIQRAERLEHEKTLVQFDNLKNQLNPHFLFNALTSLNSLIFENQQLASDFLQNLSQVYRYVLQHKEKSLVPLQVELEFIQKYVFLLQTRFAKSLQLEWHISPLALEKEVVPVTLQLLLENCIKHNIVNKANTLYIKITATPYYLQVTNNLQPKKQIHTSNRQGLENLISLYSYYASTPVTITATAETFTVQIPLV